MRCFFHGRLWTRVHGHKNGSQGTQDTPSGKNGSQGTRDTPSGKNGSQEGQRALSDKDSQQNGEAAKTSGTASGEDGQSANSQESTGFKDGTYTGTGTGFRGDTKVSVTVKNEKISDITVDFYQDDAQFFELAKSSVISEILNSQSVNVQTVSGATYSSNGILEAVADALGIDLTNSDNIAQGGNGKKQFM